MENHDLARWGQRHSAATWTDTVLCRWASWNMKWPHRVNLGYINALLSLITP